MKIISIIGREILDSRGFPTIEAVLELDNGKTVKSSVPSGASTGKREALELRDGDVSRYFGKGVLKAIENLEKKISPALIGKVPDLVEMDKFILELDGTDNKSNLGANAMLAASMVVTRAQAENEGLDLHEFISKVFKTKALTLNVSSENVSFEKQIIPKVMFNILNGGVHADNGISFQEFMIMPTSSDFNKNLQMASTVYHNLKQILKDENLSVGVGDEGGFAPIFKRKKVFAERQALDFLVQAVDKSNLKLGDDILFCLDVAASQFYDEKTGCYIIEDQKLSTVELIDFYKSLLKDYPLFSIEDALQEEDWDGWKFLTDEIGEKVQLVGDDIFVTNIDLIKKGVDLGVANSVLIKPNQIGLVTQCLESIKYSCNSDYKAIISHRSGETLDTFISDLVVGTGTGQFKSGACVRGERVSKYNRLLDLEKKLAI